MRSRDESGITVVELVVATMLVGIVSVVFLPIMASSSRSIHPMQVRSQTIDSLRNALASIGREMRSAECVSEPAANAPAPSNVLRFTTDSQSTSTDPAESSYEVTYTAADGQLLRQVTGQDDVQLVETGLVNSGDAFTHIATPRRTVKVVFHFQPDPDGKVMDLSTVIAGRNAWHAC